jgi:transposase
MERAFRRWSVRFIGLDVHRDHCEVAIAEDGRVRSAGKFKTNPESVSLFAESLGPDDQVALEATFGATKIAQLIEPYVARVVVANTRLLAAVAKGRAKKLSQN